MSRTFVAGGIDTASYALRQGPALPLLEDVPVRLWMSDCLEQAVVDRCGVILLAVQGAGKTVSAEQDVLAFEKQEHARRKTEPTYAPRRVISLTTVRATSARELYTAMYKAAFDVAPAERFYKRNKYEDELRAELVDRCQQEDVAAFVIDEAQTLTVAAFEALRDLMAVAEQRAPDRFEFTATGTLVRPAGLGVLLVGTLALAPRLLSAPDLDRRWVRTEIVGAPEVAEVPGMLRQILPAFAAGA
jgi:type II secretory pathway predicted ATPase ExeA